MKQIGYISFFIISFFLTTCTYGLEMRPQVRVLTKSDPICVITLSSNPSTGYSWSVDSYDDTLLYLKEHKYIAPETDLIGAGGQEVWQFEATKKALKTAPHMTIIKMIYSRPWELVRGQPPKSTRVFKIVIR